MQPVVRAVTVLSVGLLMTSVAGAEGKAPAAPPAAASKAEAGKIRTDRLDPAVVERETKRRTTPRQPVMPAERS